MFSTIVGVALVVFVLMRLLPGDIVELRLVGDSGGSATAEMIRIERARLGLDIPLYQQFLNWMIGVFQFDFGTSMWTGRPISFEMATRFELSLQIAVMSTLFAVALAIPLGIIAALKQDTWVDYLVRLFSIAGLAMPSFWLGILMILSFLIFFNWMPPSITFPCGKIRRPIYPS